MRIKLSDLRKIIKEEVERNLRWTAGIFSGRLSQPSKGVNFMPLPGLGATTEKSDDIDTGEYEEKKEECADDNTNRTRG